MSPAPTRTRGRRVPDDEGATTAVVRFEPKAAYSAIEAAIEAKRADITKALAKGIDPDRFLIVALQAITRQPKLLQCTPSSFVLALRDAAELGLEPSGLLGQAYLVPYKRNWRDEGGSWHNEMNAQLMPGYQGLIDLARRSSEIADIEARVVREMEPFEIEFGTGGFIRHRPFLAGDPGNIIGAYMRARLTNGVEHVEWMSIAEIEAVRKRSKAADEGPWITDYAEMCKKTVTRRGLKYLPRSVQVTKAMEQEELVESLAAPKNVTPPSSEVRDRLLARHGIAGVPDGAGSEGTPDGPQQAQEPVEPQTGTPAAPDAPDASSEAPAPAE